MTRVCMHVWVPEKARPGQGSVFWNVLFGQLCQERRHHPPDARDQNSANQARTTPLALSGMDDSGASWLGE